jgi:predicted dehydrogenase
MIGAGEIAVQTAKGIAEAPSAQLVAVMDTVESVAADLAGRYGAEHTTDAAALLGRNDVDAVYIAIPHYLHAPLTIQAAEAGKPVLCEKPIATTLADADRMIDSCRQQGVPLGIAFHAQVDAGMQAARRLIQAGAIGDLYGTFVHALSNKPETYWHGGYTQRVHTDWRPSKEHSGGGILIMNLVHDLNTLRFVSGLEAQRVYAEYGTFASPPEVEVEDFLTATVRYRGGAVGTIQAGSAIRGRVPGLPNGTRIYGTKGQIVLGRPPQVFLAEARPDLDLAANEWQEIKLAEGAARGERSQIVEQFARAVQERRQPPVTGEDGRAALEVIVAAYRAGDTGQPITLPLAQ